MNKKFYAILFGTSMALNTFSSHAEPFIKANVGYAVPTKLSDGPDGYIASKKPNNAALYGIGAGYKFNDKFLTYVDYTHVGNMKYSADVDGDNYKQNIKADLVNLNIQYNIKNDSKFVPYVKAGIGSSRNAVGTYIRTNNTTNEVEYTQESNAQNQFTWNVGAGVDYKINEKVALGTSYQYYNLGKIKSSENGFRIYRNSQEQEADLKTSNLSLHTINLGVTYFYN
jgi:opacity protein-like surface antigen